MRILSRSSSPSLLLFFLFLLSAPSVLAVDLSVGARFALSDLVGLNYSEIRSVTGTFVYGVFWSIIKERENRGEENERDIGERRTQSGRFMDKRQGTLHNSRQSVDALAEQRPAAK